MDRLLTIGELAEHLNIAEGAAYRWLAEGRLHCVRFSSRCVRFRESDVKKMIEQLVDAPTGNPVTPSKQKLVCGSTQSMSLNSKFASMSLDRKVNANDAIRRKFR